MNKIFNKFRSLASFYKILYELIFQINNIKLNYILIFLFILFFSAFFEISLLAFLYVLIKAFMDPNYHQGNFFFKYFFQILEIKNNSQLILYLSSFFIITCLFYVLFS